MLDLGSRTNLDAAATREGTRSIQRAPTVSRTTEFPRDGQIMPAGTLRALQLLKLEGQDLNSADGIYYDYRFGYEFGSGWS
jgi:hypothetical protein